MDKKHVLARRIAERRHEDALERRSRILAAARKVFSETGYRNATVRDIAIEAALSPGLIYHYYAGKDELYGLICEEAFHLLLDYTRQACGGEGTALDRLFAFAWAYVRYYRDNPQYFDIISFRDLGFRKVSLPGPILQRIEGLSFQTIEELRKLVLACMQEGSFRRSDDARQAAVCLWAALEGLIFIDKRGYVETFKLDLDRLVDELLTTLHKGLKP